MTELKPADPQQCRYAIMPGNEADAFKAAAGPTWREFRSSEEGRILFGRDQPTP